MTVVNIYGSSGSGKSTIATGVYSKLKAKRISVGLATEFLMELVLDQSFATSDIPYVIGCQWHRLVQNRKYAFCITDSPLPELGIIHKGIPEEFLDFACLLDSKHPTINWVLKRRFPLWHPSGRPMDRLEDDRRNMDEKIVKLLQDRNIPYREIESNNNAIEVIIEDIIQRI